MQFFVLYADGIWFSYFRESKSTRIIEPCYVVARFFLQEHQPDCVQYLCTSHWYSHVHSLGYPQYSYNDDLCVDIPAYNKELHNMHLHLGSIVLHLCNSLLYSFHQHVFLNLPTKLCQSKSRFWTQRISQGDWDDLAAFCERYYIFISYV